MQFTDSKSQQQSPLVAFLATTVLVIIEAVFVPVVSFLEFSFPSAVVCFRFSAAIVRGHRCSAYQGFCEALSVQ